MACTDPVILNLWHPIAAVAESAVGVVHTTTLLERRVSFVVDASGGAAARLHGLGDPLPVRVRYGYVWVSLGTPEGELFTIPEYDQPDRRNLNASTIGVHVSAPRAVENFLDLGHFPFVHTGVLGVEPHTEVPEYEVEISAERDEILATGCRAFQPKAAASSASGADVEYTFRVPHPYCGVLYKSSGADPARSDVIALFLQAVDQEHTRAHLLLSVLDHEHADKEIRHFQQSVFGQDKPILENQYPKRLPLDPRAETPIRADKSGVAYRRWLSRKGVTYGVLPAGTEAGSPR